MPLKLCAEARGQCALAMWHAFVAITAYDTRHAEDRGARTQDCILSYSGHPTGRRDLALG